ncbi:MAG: hypothetical protein IAF38_07910 [Bacteroidia bacterium]|nr:hypothetical protein [Bacteroidia bacterium]
MKKIFAIALLVVLCFSFSGKKYSITFPGHLSKTIVARLADKDSICYYQCYCAISGTPPTYLPVDSVKKRKMKTGMVTVTDKFVLNKNGNVYRLRHFQSSLYDYPNKKFAYLKLKEKAYWNFTLSKDTTLSELSVFKLAALELKLRPLTETYFQVLSDNYPQVILNSKKTSEQRLVEGNYLIRKELPELGFK